MSTTFVRLPTFSRVEPDAGLRAAAALAPKGIVAEIESSGLKGRGGAGFPTALKWRLAQEAPGTPKYVVCNADEGEPGTFKDRVLLERHPHLVVEGLTIAARAVGAREGIVYLRGEYAYLRAPLEAVLESRRQSGRLGGAILGVPGFDFDVTIRMGSGAYVCGEETALLESLEGYRGEPRKRPPFPVSAGFLGKPSAVNNVETLAWAAGILAHGAAWFRAEGTAQSAGRKIFSVSGDCERPGVYELPLGITVEELLDEVGGAGAKAVQVGGASGGCLPASEFSRTLAFEDASTGGSIIVFGPHRDMLAVARNFLEFFVEESCGQCTPCRAGNPRLLDGVRLLEAGRCSTAHLDALRSLGETMQLASKCGLGQSSPNAFLSIVKHFSGEIMGRAPAA